MHSILKLTILPVVCCLAAAGVIAAQTVTVATGKLQGISSDGVMAYKGIPYAAPPVGKLRWRSPQPAASWKGVRQATQYGHDCMQLPFPSDTAPLGTQPAEDCLVLNVMVPAKHGPTPLPVMVWIYGGGFVNGGSSPAVYDGSQFARNGVVFVSFNYRLGRFGFFAHPALTKENPNGPLGNYAYMDQIAALKWVQSNIAAFGGDPKNVTLFGESAGGGSVHVLLTSSLAQGLFQKAIVESGGGRKRSGGEPRLHEPANGKPAAESVGMAFAESKGIRGDGAAALEKLRALPAESVVDGLNMASMNAATYSGPMIDGKIVVAEAQEAYLAGMQQRVPLVVGANSLEMPFAQAKSMDEVLSRFGDKAEAARQAYDPEHTGEVAPTAMKINSDAMAVEPARFVAATIGDMQPVYEYRFSYVADSMRKEWKGAPHATEIPFVFDTVKARYEAAMTPADEKVAQAMNACWLQFAKTGNPSVPGKPAWPRYTRQGDRLMNFTADGPVPMADPWKARLDLVEAIQH
jgi:para-nitrobenzyl esterase